MVAASGALMRVSPGEDVQIKGACLFHYHGGKVGLISERVGKPFNLPGGKLEAGETPREGLDRELKEEIGFEIVATLVYKRAIVSSIGGAHNTVFLCENTEEIGGLTYFALDDLPGKLTPWVLRVLWDVQGRPRNDAFITLTQVFRSQINDTPDPVDGPIYEPKKGTLLMFDRRDVRAARAALKAVGGQELT